MILAVSVGNTNVRAAVGQGSVLKQTVFRRAFLKSGNTDTHGTIEALEAGYCPVSNYDECHASVIKRIQDGLGIVWGQIRGGIVSTVVPGCTDVIVSNLEGKIGRPVQRIDVKHCGGLDIELYENLPGEDRVVCCAHALQKFTPPFVVVDYGTATTVNVVNAKGQFMGGAILPGLQTGLDALAHNTAQLPQISMLTKKSTIPLIGKNTAENLQSGAVIGLACATEGFIRRISEFCEFAIIERGSKIPVIVTGGHGSAILPYCQFDCIHEPDLLLEGLLSLYRS